VRYRRDIVVHRAAASITGMALIASAACGPKVVEIPPPAPPKVDTPPPTPEADGPHRDAITALVQPFLDAELLKAAVVGVYDQGTVEIYGFGVGPDGKPPDGGTLFELGGVTKLYTSLLLCDAVQREEVKLDDAVAGLLPAGVAVPTKNGQAITLRELANEASGLPQLPPSLARDAADPYADYTEDRLLADLPHIRLDAAPGTRIATSTLGTGLLGYVLGRRGGSGYAATLGQRVLAPLQLASTYVTVPADARSRRTVGTTTDLAAATPWHWDVLAPAGGLVSDARDQLAVMRAEIDAANNGPGMLRPALRLTQEAQLDRDGENEAIGLQIDAAGRYWRNGATAGFHAFVGFDPKYKRAVVILASTALSPLDRIADLVYDVLDGKPRSLPAFPTAAQLVPYAGSYEIAGTHLDIILDGARLYVAGPGEPRHRLVPLTPNEFWLEELGAVMVFEGDGSKITRLSLVLPNGQRVSGPRA
jgi:D-alanyl-D-alanine-carboxypeptidase/D-alanyl-D-alanine-endopeptidase